MLKKIDTWLDIERYLREAAEAVQEREREVETSEQRESEEDS